jgi:hypothetical protein
MEEEERETQIKSKTADSNAQSRQQLFVESERGTATVDVDSIMANDQLFRKKRMKRNIYRGRSTNIMKMQQTVI